MLLFDPRGAIKTLSWCLSEGMESMRAKKLTFNPETMEVLIVVPNLVLESRSSPLIDGVKVPLTMCLQFGIQHCSWMSRQWQ